MGLEAQCTVRHGRRTTEAKVQLESADVIVRGDWKLTIPFRAMPSVRARDGKLEIAWPEGTTVLELGPDSEKWAKKIQNPKSRIDKLGVKAGQKVSVTGIDDAAFLSELRARTEDVSAGRIAKGSDVIFLGISAIADLKKIAAAVKSLERDGMIWVVWPKGRPALMEDHVRDAAIAQGLVDVKVAAFSETLSALKLVIRLENR